MCWLGVAAQPELPMTVKGDETPSGAFAVWRSGKRPRAPLGGYLTKGDVTTDNNAAGRERQRLFLGRPILGRHHDGTAADRIRAEQKDQVICLLVLERGAVRVRMSTALPRSRTE